MEEAASKVSMRAVWIGRLGRVGRGVDCEWLSEGGRDECCRERGGSSVRCKAEMGVFERGCLCKRSAEVGGGCVFNTHIMCLALWTQTIPQTTATLLVWYLALKFWFETTLSNGPV